MSWLTIIRLIVVWYATVQIVTLAVLPLTLHVLRALPDRGYSLAKICGILVVGVGYWLGYSYGLVRNERGGVWLALLVVAGASWAHYNADVIAWWRALRGGGRWRALIAAEVIFVVAFIGWALVRAYDPNVEHTEQPMDLMFVNSIWASATYPPQDAWLAGYAISYYYLGYWLLATMARIANTPPNVAYNLGQAVWYGYLWLGCFGVVSNLLAWRWGSSSQEAETTGGNMSFPVKALIGGFFSGTIVAFAGNLQVVLEWLYARGANIQGLIEWVDVHNFPENASRTGQWHIDFGWWWWRSSRVIADRDLSGNYLDVIDEFPMFSYLLGDNHPHVMAMPVALLVIGLSLNLYMLLVGRAAREEERAAGSWLGWLPVAPVDVVVTILALGSLVFLNTWDFPPYWLLLVAIVYGVAGFRWQRTLAVGGLLFVGTIVFYLPYFLTAQSQAAGIVPNLFNPTRLSQFLVMFGSMVPAVVALEIVGWRRIGVSWNTFSWVAGLVIGVPVAFLGLSAALSSTNWGKNQLARMALPEGVGSYAEVFVERWSNAPWTLLLVGLLLSVVLATLVSLIRKPVSTWAGSADLIFMMLLVAIGLALVFAPEFVFLRDHFGTRMNTVFKFYYQGWLLLGLASAYVIAIALFEVRRQMVAVVGLGMLSLILVISSLLFPFAGVYSKTNGFARAMPTLDSTAYVGHSNPDVLAAVEWVQRNTTPDDLVLEAKGGSYAAHHNRISTMTGRPTLLGWEGHESQWRGDDYGTMARGRSQAIEVIYRTARGEELSALLEEWNIDYLFVGPAEIERYGITSFRLEELAAELNTVFARGQVRIFRPRNR